MKRLRVYIETECWIYVDFRSQFTIINFSFLHFLVSFGSWFPWLQRWSIWFVVLVSSFISFFLGGSGVNRTGWLTDSLTDIWCLDIHNLSHPSAYLSFHQDALVAIAHISVPLLSLWFYTASRVASMYLFAYPVVMATSLFCCPWSKQTDDEIDSGPVGGCWNQQ